MKFFVLTSWFPVCGALRRGRPEPLGFGKNAVWYDVAKGGTFFPFDGATGQFGLARALAAGWLTLGAILIALWSKVACVGAWVEQMGEIVSTGKKWKMPGRKEKEGWLALFIHPLSKPS